MRYLGLDLGSKTLGIALSDLTNIIATNDHTVYFKEDNYSEALEKLKPIIEENKITTIILGLPKNMNNSLGKRAEITIEFKKMIETAYQLEVILEDERLTSVISNNILISSDISRKKRKKAVDKISAAIILQSYLDKIKK